MADCNSELQRLMQNVEHLYSELHNSYPEALFALAYINVITNVYVAYIKTE